MKPQNFEQFEIAFCSKFQVEGAFFLITTGFMKFDYSIEYTFYFTHNRYKTWQKIS